MLIGSREYTYEEAQKAGYFLDMSKADYDKKTKECFERMVSSSVWSKEVPIDEHGLIWVGNRVFVNLFQSYYRVKKSETMRPSLWCSE